MRGKGMTKEQAILWVGITPAYAGKSTVRRQRTCVPWDHPRVCGEKILVDGGIRTGVGSPPRMRGKV